MDAVAVGIFLYAGQSCTAGSRLLLHRSIHDAFLDGLIERARALKVGSPLDEDDPARPDGLGAPARSRPRLRRARSDRAGAGWSSAASGSVASGPTASTWRRRSSTTSVPTCRSRARRSSARSCPCMSFDDEDEALRDRERQPARARQRRLDERPRPGDPAGASAARRRRLGQHPLRPAGREPVRWRQGQRHRPRARHGRARRVPRIEARLHRQLPDVPHPLTCRHVAYRPVRTRRRSPRGAGSASRSTAGRSRRLEGEPLAVALLAAGRPILSRSFRFHRPRGLMCDTGQCGWCECEVDGRPSVRSCQVPVRDGLVARSEHAWPSADRDLFGLLGRRVRDWSRRPSITIGSCGRGDSASAIST